MIWFALNEGWRSFRNLGIGGMLTLASLSVTLTLAALTAEGYSMLAQWNSALLKKFEIEAFLSTDVAEDRTNAIRGQIEHLQGVRGVDLVSRAAALDRFKNEFDTDLLNVLGYNPLPASLIITLTDDAVRGRQWPQIAQQIKSMGGVDDVSYQGELVGEIDLFYKRMGRSLGLLIGGALLLSLFFAWMTIAAAIKSRGEFIHILLLCGGSRLMARGPFIALGGYYGIAAGVIGLLFTMVITAIVSVGWEIQAKVPLNWAPLLIIAGVLIGAITAGSVAGNKIRTV